MKDNLSFTARLLAILMKFTDYTIKIDRARQDITEHINNTLIGPDESIEGQDSVETVARQMRNAVRTKQRDALMSFDIQGPISLCLDDIDRRRMTPGIAMDLIISLLELQLAPNKQDVVADPLAATSEERANILFVEQLKKLGIYGKRRMQQNEA